MAGRSIAAVCAIALSALLCADFIGVGMTQEKRYRSDFLGLHAIGFGKSRVPILEARRVGGSSYVGTATEYRRGVFYVLEEPPLQPGDTFHQ